MALASDSQRDPRFCQDESANEHLARLERDLARLRVIQSAEVTSLVEELQRIVDEIRRMF